MSQKASTIIREDAPHPDGYRPDLPLRGGINSSEESLGRQLRSAKMEVARLQRDTEFLQHQLDTAKARIADLEKPATGAERSA